MTYLIAKKGVFDGTKLTLTVSVDPALGATVHGAVVDAATSWNQHTGATKIEWNVLPLGVGALSGDVFVEGISKFVKGQDVAGLWGNTFGCGRASPIGGGIQLPTDIVQRNSRAEIAIAVAHEQGHWYGVPNVPSGIMEGLQDHDIQLVSTDCQL